MSVALADSFASLFHHVPVKLWLPAIYYYRLILGAFLSMEAFIQIHFPKHFVRVVEIRTSIQTVLSHDGLIMAY